MPEITDDLELAFSKFKPVLEKKQRGGIITYAEIKEVTGLGNPTRLREKIRKWLKRERQWYTAPIRNIGYEITTAPKQLTEVYAKQEKRKTRIVAEQFNAVLGAEDEQLSDREKNLKHHRIRNLGSQLAEAKLRAHEEALILGMPPPRPRLK